MRYISAECEYFSARFVPNPALLPEMLHQGVLPPSSSPSRTAGGIPVSQLEIAQPLGISLG
jgi:hypothetical protein